MSQACGTHALGSPSLPKRSLDQDCAQRSGHSEGQNPNRCSKSRARLSPHTLRRGATCNWKGKKMSEKNNPECDERAPDNSEASPPSKNAKDAKEATDASGKKEKSGKTFVRLEISKRELDKLVSAMEKAIPAAKFGGLAILRKRVYDLLEMGIEDLALNGWKEDRPAPETIRTPSQPAASEIDQETSS